MKRINDLQYDADEAVRHLTGVDPTLKQLIERVGPFGLEVGSMLDPFQVLLRSIVYQQLSGRAAAAIYDRVVKAVGSDPPTPSSVERTADQTLRNAGLSWAKIAGLRDLARHSIDGTIPSLETLHAADNEEVVERLTVVRGIGRWTVEMLLIFRLGRADVFPVTDLGVRKGYMLTYGLDALPTPKELEKLCEHWRPYRSVASWYLWRAVDGVP